MNRTDIERIWTTSKSIWIKLTDGRELKEDFADYPRLQTASSEARNAYTTSYFGLHWPALDEDLSFDGFVKDSL